jgi:hypothetical protein
VRNLINFFVCVLLVMRAAIPAGFMFGPAAAEGDLTIVVCTAYGAKVADASEPGAPFRSDRKTACDSCVCSATQTLAPLLDHPCLVTSFKWADVVYKPALKQFSETPRFSAQSARGPPHVLI